MKKRKSAGIALACVWTALLILTGCGSPAVETTPETIPTVSPSLPSEPKNTAAPSLPPTETPEETPAPEELPANQWIRLGPDETPPPGAWVRYAYDEEQGYGQEYQISTVTWAFDEDTKTLTFSGEGSLPDGVTEEDLSYGLPLEVLRFPWDEVRESVTTLILEEGIIRIPEGAFADCGNLTRVKLPSTLKILEPCAFSSCGFSEIELPEGLEELGSDAFSFCGELLHCEIPASVSDLYAGLFRGCQKLETVILHEGLTTIGSECFDGCDSLKRLVIPASVNWLDDQNIQYGSTGLNTFVFLGPPPNPMLEVDVGYTILDCIPKGSTIYYPAYEVERTSLQDDDWSNYVGEKGYTWVAGLPEDLPDSLSLPPILVTWDFDEATGTLTFTGRGAMPRDDWRDLVPHVTAVVVGEGITRVRESAFHDFEGLETVTLPSTLTAIGDYAFFGCGLKEVNIPAGVEKLGHGAFSYCESLRSCHIWGDISTLEPAVFEYCGALETLFFMGEGPTRLEKGCLRDCGALTTLIIPATVTQVEELGATGLRVLVFEGEPPAMPWDPETGEFWGSCGDLAWVYYPEGSEAWAAIAAQCTGDITWIEGIPEDGM